MMAQRAHVIVVANAKGGSGKSTTAMHIAVRMLSMRQGVGLLDLDARQATLGRYMHHRRAYGARQGVALPMPTYRALKASEARDRDAAEVADHAALTDVMAAMLVAHDVVIVDCPGADTYLARLAHRFADTLVTPINDSFVDIDLLADVDPESHTVRAPSWYSTLVWEERKARHLEDGHAMDWVVVRNRISHTDSRNKRHTAGVLQALSAQIGFRLVPGLGDRVIFRELFLKGLTLSDTAVPNLGLKLTMAHVAAHQEIKGLVRALRLQDSAVQAVG